MSIYDSENIFSKIKENGFYHYPVSLIDNFQLEKLYSAYNLLINNSETLLNNGNLTKFDQALQLFLKLTNSKLEAPLLSLHKLTHPIHPQVLSYQYLVNLYPSLKKLNQHFDPLIDDFLSQLEQLSHSLISTFTETFPLELNKNDIQCLLKISKYTSGSNEKFLIPPHYDRTIFTLILDTQNSENQPEEQLVLYPKKSGTNLNELRNASYIKVNKNDLPLLFTGGSGESSFNIPATAHAVLNFKEPIPEVIRYSLVFFILPINLDQF